MIIETVPSAPLWQYGNWEGSKDSKKGKRFCITNIVQPTMELKSSRETCVALPRYQISFRRLPSYSHGKIIHIKIMCISVGFTYLKILTNFLGSVASPINTLELQKSLAMWKMRILFYFWGHRHQECGLRSS
jgi:hypothetical protein